MKPPTMEVHYPSGAVREVQLLRMLVQTQNAEFKANHGMFLPGLNKFHPTIRDLRDEYEIPAKTWKQAAIQMRERYVEFKAAYAEASR